MIVNQDALLNQIWSKWIDRTYDLQTLPYISRDYARVARRTTVAKKFEDWLWANGAGIRRINKKCYLEFANEDDATVFILRNSQ